MSAEGDPPARRERLADLRRELSSLGFRPSRRLGQNFLLDAGLHEAVCRAAEVAPGEGVIEIGVGMGFLTRALLDRGARVLGFEIDERLVKIARRVFGPDDEVELVVGDALAGKHRLAPRLEQALEADPAASVVANLPYAVSGPLLALLAEREQPPPRVTVLVQLELAERLCARPAERAWGPLSARVQAAFSPRIVRRVPPSSFWPRPKVESAIVRLDRRPDALEPRARRHLSAAVAQLLPRRRQVIRRVLGDLLGDRRRAEQILGELGIPPDRRVQGLGVAELAALGAVLGPAGPPDEAG